MGLSIDYKFSDRISADLAVFNGEGYTKLEADSTFKTAVGLTVKPIEGITVRGLYDYISKRDATQQTKAVFLGYARESISVGAEYNHQDDFGLRKGRQLYGTSFYSTWKPSSQVKIFARYDRLRSNKLANAGQTWNYSSEGNLLIAGVEYSPVKGIKLSPNYRGWNPSDASRSFASTFILNCEIRF